MEKLTFLPPKHICFHFCDLLPSQILMISIRSLLALDPSLLDFSLMLQRFFKLKELKVCFIPFHSDHPSVTHLYSTSYSFGFLHPLPNNPDCSFCWLFLIMIISILISSMCWALRIYQTWCYTLYMCDLTYLFTLLWQVLFLTPADAEAVLRVTELAYGSLRI